MTSLTSSLNLSRVNHTAIDRLPPEVLCDIFFQCLPEARSRRTRPEFIKNPLLISHICQKWRKLALSFGPLWSYLSLTFFGKRRLRQKKTTKEIFDAWLQRTNGCPLNFDITCRIFDDADEEDRRTWAHIIAMLVSHQQRWQDVEFDWRGVMSEDLFSESEPNPTNMPLLINFSFTCRITMPENYNPLLPSVDLTHSPRLQSIHLSGFHDLKLENKASFPQMKTSNMICPLGISADRAAKRCRDLLSAAPNLIKLSVEFRRAEWVEGLRTEGRVVHNLKYFKITHDHHGEIVNGLTLPKLEALHFAHNRTRTLQSEAFVSFIQRSMPPLSHLDIAGPMPEEDLLIPVLRNLPTLQYLRLKGVVVSTALVRTLTLRNQSATWQDSSGAGDACPSLKLLQLFSSIPPVDDPEAFREMLLSRRSTFKRVVTETNPVMNIEDVKNLSYDELRKWLTSDKVRAEGDNIEASPFD